MNDEQKVGEWERWYRAAPPSYKAQALFAVAANDPALLDAVIQRLGLDLKTLLLHMRDEPEDKVLQTKQRRHAK